MAAITDENTVPSVAEETTQLVTPKAAPMDFKYESNIVDTSEVDFSTLLTHISGYSQVVDYLWQVLGKDQVGNQQQVNQEAVYQQYVRIKGFEIKVQNELIPNQNVETGEFEGEGTAIIYPSIKPNQGDMWISDVGDGRSAIFSISTVKRLSILKEACHEITFKIIAWATEERVKDLESKVVKSLNFHKENIYNPSSSAFLTDSEEVEWLDVAQSLKDSVDLYFFKFYNQNYKTFTFTKAGNVLYDHYLIKFMEKLLTEDLRQEHPRVVPMNVGTANALSLPTIWDKLVDGGTALYGLVEQMRVVPCSAFIRKPEMAGIAFSTVTDIVYPKDQLTEGEMGVHSRMSESYSYWDYQQHAEMSDVKFQAHPISIDDYYVFSQHFYANNVEGMSEIEILVRKYLEGGIITYKDAKELFNHFTEWEDSMQYYYGPIVILMLMMAR